MSFCTFKGAQQSILSQLYPLFERGKGPIKSTVLICQGKLQIFSLPIRPTLPLFGAFCAPHILHERTYFKISCLILGSSSEDLEDWVENGSHIDDIDFTVFEQEDIEIFEPKDLNLEDFVLVRFKLTGKRSTTTYRYVAKILEILSSEENEIQCYKTANDEKTVFYPIENDISTINQFDILGKLPEPTVEDKGRKCKTIFPGQVDISEQI
ncbi:hypothetical protein RN001_009060 [Aquatica leii]|uniref:Uncharacterized protein n=1 Tax=Aquatica leii TaxID=1421715 RepID=A0AAN7SFH0_9COLE|nr:hypothetical protein RN001_009060 [Aquatica leii]